MTDLFAQTGPELTLPELLLEARLRNKFTVSELAIRLQCPVVFYEALESGERVPGTKWVPKLSRTLTIPLDALKDAIDHARTGKTADRAR